MNAPPSRVESYAVAQFCGIAMLLLCVMAASSICVVHLLAHEPRGAAIDALFAMASVVGVGVLSRIIP
ncbi:MAG TPA: hypothetical protein VIO57_10065 [Chloroflexota bacterium]|jgi:hypothetical protein